MNDYIVMQNFSYEKNPPSPPYNFSRKTHVWNKTSKHFVTQPQRTIPNIWLWTFYYFFHIVNHGKYFSRKKTHPNCCWRYCVNLNRRVLKGVHLLRFPTLKGYWAGLMFISLQALLLKKLIRKTYLCFSHHPKICYLWSFFYSCSYISHNFCVY